MRDEAPESDSDDNDTTFVDKQEQFEETYNHRFTEAGADTVLTYPRSVPSERVDPKQERRRSKREKRKEQKEAAKQKTQEDLEKIKTEKKKQILEKMKEIKDLTGNDALDVEDFDPQQFEKALSSMYEEGADDSKPSTKKAKALKGELDKYLEEFYNLDFEDLIAGEIPTRFKYESVAANSFGMSIEEMLTTPEAQLSAKAPMMNVLSKYGDGKMKPKRHDFKNKRGQNFGHKGVKGQKNDKDNNNNKKFNKKKSKGKKEEKSGE